MKTGTTTPDLDTPIDILDADEEALQVARKPERGGFLPIQTNWFDRLFISIVLWIALSLIWMRFLEQSLPLWIASVIAFVVAVFIIRKG
jgi:predicted small integral membrane protein